MGFRVLTRILKLLSKVDDVRLIKPTFVDFEADEDSRQTYAVRHELCVRKTSEIECCSDGFRMSPVRGSETVSDSAVRH